MCQQIEIASGAGLKYRDSGGGMRDEHIEESVAQAGKIVSDRPHHTAENTFKTMLGALFSMTADRCNSAAPPSRSSSSRWVRSFS